MNGIGGGLQSPVETLRNKVEQTHKFMRRLQVSVTINNVHAWWKISDDVPGEKAGLNGATQQLHRILLPVKAGFDPRWFVGWSSQRASIVCCPCGSHPRQASLGAGIQLACGTSETSILADTAMRPEAGNYIVNHVATSEIFIWGDRPGNHMIPARIRSIIENMDTVYID
jgi:hypothetical protein